MPEYLVVMPALRTGILLCQARTEPARPPEGCLLILVSLG